jgi:hypothetical protein
MTGLRNVFTNTLRRGAMWALGRLRICQTHKKSRGAQAPRL